MSGWMYWDGKTWVPANAAEIARQAQITGKTQIVTWNFGQHFNARTSVEPTPKEPWAELSAEPDPAGIICRPCSEDAHAECEGSAVKCRCQLCNLLPTIRDMTEEWDLFDRLGGIE